jgi:hypothetical protein
MKNLHPVGLEETTCLVQAHIHNICNPNCDAFILNKSVKNPLIPIDSTNRTKGRVTI